MGICGCSVFLHPAEEIPYQKFAACISSEWDCDSGLDNVSFSLLCAGSLECQEGGAEELMCLCGALGCSDGAGQTTQALQHCPGMRKLSLLPREICCIPPTGRTGLPSPAPAAACCWPDDLNSLALQELCPVLVCSLLATAFSLHPWLVPLYLHHQRALCCLPSCCLRG